MAVPPIGQAAHDDFFASLLGRASLPRVAFAELPEDIRQAWAGVEIGAMARALEELGLWGTGEALAEAKRRLAR
jgi:hypothetical protein